MRTTKDIEIDDTIEARITMDIVVDAYNEDERAMGWYYHLESKLGFPFQGKLSRNAPSLHSNQTRR